MPESLRDVHSETIAAYTERMRRALPTNRWWEIFKRARLQYAFQSTTDGKSDTYEFGFMAAIMITMIGAATSNFTLLWSIPMLGAGIAWLALLIIAASKMRPPGKWKTYTVTDCSLKYTLPLRILEHIAAMRKDDPMAEFDIDVLEQRGEEQAFGFVLNHLRRRLNVVEFDPVCIVDAGHFEVGRDKILNAFGPAAGIGLAI